MRDARRRLRRLAHGRDRDRAGRRRRGVPAAPALQRRRASSPSGGAQYSRAVPRGRRRARRPLHLPPRRPTASSPSPTPPTTSKDLAWFQRHAGGFDVEVARRARRLRDARRPGPAARARSSQALADAPLPDALHRRRTRTVAGAPRARLRHRLHRRGRRRAARRAPSDAAAVWDALRAPPAPTPAGPRRARHAAPRGLLPPLRQRPDRRSAARSRPASAGAARRTRASSAPRPSRAAREAGPREKLVPFALDRPRHRPPGQPGRRRRRGHERHAVARAWASASAWPTCRPSSAEPGTALEIDVRGKAAPAEVRTKPLYSQGELNRGRRQLPRRPDVPRRARLGPHRRRHRHVRHHLVRPGRSSARSCSSTRPRSARR